MRRLLGIFSGPEPILLDAEGRPLKAVGKPWPKAVHEKQLCDIWKMVTNEALVRGLPTMKDSLGKFLKADIGFDFTGAFFGPYVERDAAGRLVIRNSVLNVRGMTFLHRYSYDVAIEFGPECTSVEHLEMHLMVQATLIRPVSIEKEGEKEKRRRIPVFRPVEGCFHILLTN